MRVLLQLIIIIVPTRAAIRSKIDSEHTFSVVVSCCGHFSSHPHLVSKSKRRQFSSKTAFIDPSKKTHLYLYLGPTTQHRRSPTNGPFLTLEHGRHGRGHTFKQRRTENYSQRVHVYGAQGETRGRHTLEMHPKGLLQSKQNSLFICFFFVNIFRC